MFDRRVRAWCHPALDRAAGVLARRGVRANSLTLVGWLTGVGACVAVGERRWPIALGAWLTNRLLDGLDGALARRRGATAWGGYLDLLADFSVYAGFVAALAFAEPSTRVPAVVLLVSYYLSGSALLAGSAILDRRGVARRDDRSFNFLGGLAEGLETMVAYAVILVAPSSAAPVEWVFALMVLVTALQRVAVVRRELRRSLPVAESTRHRARVR